MVELGQKQECPKCGVKFYDFGKADVACPKCEPEEEAADEEQKPDDDSEE